jgi:hypothetical protein
VGGAVSEAALRLGETSFEEDRDGEAEPTAESGVRPSVQCLEAGLSDTRRLSDAISVSTLAVCGAARVLCLERTVKEKMFLLM